MSKNRRNEENVNSNVVYKSDNYELFLFFEQEHNLILTDEEIDAIKFEVKEKTKRGENELKTK